jgi:hypothetical protein
MIGNLVILMVGLCCEVTIGYHPRRAQARLVEGHLPELRFQLLLCRDYMQEGRRPAAGAAAEDEGEAEASARRAAVGGVRGWGSSSGDACICYSRSVAAWAGEGTRVPSVWGAIARALYIFLYENSILHACPISALLPLAAWPAK